MKTSESIVKISMALLGCQNEFLVLKKEAQGQRNKYAKYEQLIAKAKPILTKAKIVLIQPIDHIDGISAITTMLIHSESGEFFQSTAPITQMDDIVNAQGKSTINQAQREGGGISYAKRYALGSMLSWAMGDYDFDQENIDLIDGEIDLIKADVALLKNEEELKGYYGANRASKHLKDIVKICADRKKEINANS